MSSSRLSCVVCMGNFSKKEFKVHRKTHSAPFECHVCNKMFKEIRGLRCHLKTHTKVNQQICPICWLPLACKRNLERHMVSWHSDAVEKTSSEELETMWLEYGDELAKNDAHSHSCLTYSLFIRGGKIAAARQVDLDWFGRYSPVIQQEDFSDYCQKVGNESLEDLGSFRFTENFDQGSIALSSPTSDSTTSSGIQWNFNKSADDQWMGWNDSIYCSNLSSPAPCSSAGSHGAYFDSSSFSSGFSDFASESEALCSPTNSGSTVMMSEMEPYVFEDYPSSSESLAASDSNDQDQRISWYCSGSPYHQLQSPHSPVALIDSSSLKARSEPSSEPTDALTELLNELDGFDTLNSDFQEQESAGNQYQD